MKRIAVAALVVFLADQLTKFVVLNRLSLPDIGVIEVLPPWVKFTMAWNRGVNFGLFAGESGVTRWILIVLSLAISLWLLIWARKLGSVAGQIFAGLIIGGALGNVVDRLAYGAVADFLNLACCGFANPYAFNIADIAIFGGAFGLVLVSNKLDKNG